MVCWCSPIQYLRQNHSSAAPPNIIKDILTSTCYDVCHETDLAHSKGLSDAWDNQIFIKREDTQVN